MALANLLTNSFDDYDAAIDALDTFVMDRPLRRRSGTVRTTSLPALIQELTGWKYEGKTYLEIDVPSGSERELWRGFSTLERAAADDAYDVGSLLFIDDVRPLLYAGPSIIGYTLSGNFKHYVAYLGGDRIIDGGMVREIDLDALPITDITIVERTLWYPDS